MVKTFLPLFLLVVSVSFLHAQVVAYTLGPTNVVAFNIPANTTAATIPVDSNQFALPSQIVASPNGSRVYALFEGNASVPSKILVINTATNAAVATIPNVGQAPLGLAITPDGAHIYVADQLNAVFIVDTATNTVEANSIAVSGGPSTLIVTPDGTQVYVAQESGRSVSVISTATNTVVGSPIPIGCVPLSKMTITPDGTQVYVGCEAPGAVIAISRATNTVSATIPFDGIVFRLAVTPDGKALYVSGLTSGDVGVINTATNTLTTSIPVGAFPTGVAATPDGADVYVTIRNNSTATEIDTSSNSAVTTGIPVAGGPQDLVIVTATIPFAAFSVKLDISSSHFDLKGTASLGAGGTINPPTQSLTLRVGTYTVTFPAGSFKAGPKGTFTFEGTISGVALQIRIAPLGGNSYSIQAEGSGANLTGITNPVTVGLTIGRNAGTTSVTADH
jgi:YVTN family beta-propeller protein